MNTTDALPEASRLYGEIDTRSDAPRWGMLVDAERCVGCWACAVSCKAENGIPLGMWWNRVLTDGEGLDTPRVEDTGSPSMAWAPLACQHCDEAPCVKVCPTGATYTNDEGLNLVDPDLCIGCRYCMAACPYGVRVFNWGEPTRASVEDGMVEARPVGTVEKCSMCVQRLEENQVPACVRACPEDARVFGDWNDPDSRLVAMAHSAGAERLLEEKGTKPNVAYLPPRRRRSL